MKRCPIRRPRNPRRCRAICMRRSSFPPSRPRKAFPAVCLAIAVASPLYSCSRGIFHRSISSTTATEPPPPMAAPFSVALDSVLDISDAYLRLGAAYDLHAAATPTKALLNNDHEVQDPPMMALAMYNQSMAAHDYAVTLANWLNTMGGQYRPLWREPPAEYAIRAAASTDELDEVQKALENSFATLKRTLRKTAMGLHDWPTLSFLRLAETSTLHDPAPDPPPTAGELADLPDYLSCTGFPPDALPPPPICDPTPPITNDISPPRPLPQPPKQMDPGVADGGRALAYSMLHHSRIALAFAHYLDGTPTSLKGFEQWFNWRAKSERVNAMTLLHYLSGARGVDPYRSPTRYLMCRRYMIC